MTYKTAANFFNDDRTSEILTGAGSLRGSILDLTRQMANRQALKRQAQKKPDHWTVGDVIHGAIGAALGMGVARGAANVLGLGDRLKDKLETIGMGVGAAMNTGYIKMAEEAEASLADQISRVDELQPKIAQARKHAFRLGFVRALQDMGHFEKDAAVMPLPIVTLDPTQILSIPKSIAKGVGAGGELAGTALGVSDAMDEDDVEISRINVETELLREQLQKLKADRRNAALKAILAKRRRKS